MDSINELARLLPLCIAVTAFVACEPLDEAPGTPGEGGGALTAKESGVIHGNVLRLVNDALQFADADVMESQACAPSGLLSVSGTRQGSSIDRTYDVAVTASDCWFVTVNAETNVRTEVVIAGGPVDIVKDMSGGVTASGTFEWAAANGRGGTCEMVDGSCR